MKKTNVKKLRNLIIFLLAIFLIFIILLNTSHNYNLEYTINDVKVNENYHKKAKYSILFIENKLVDHLEEILETALKRIEKIIQDLKAQSNLTATLRKFVF